MWSTLMQIVNKYMLWNFMISDSPDDLSYIIKETWGFQTGSLKFM